MVHGVLRLAETLSFSKVRRAFSPLLSDEVRLALGCSTAFPFSRAARCKGGCSDIAGVAIAEVGALLRGVAGRLEAGFREGGASQFQGRTPAMVLGPAKVLLGSADDASQGPRVPVVSHCQQAPIALQLSEETRFDFHIGGYRDHWQHLSRPLDAPLSSRAPANVL